MIAQLIIGLFGVGAIFLSQNKDWYIRRWACVLGLLAQPAWFWASISAEQWGIVLLNVFYTFAWAKGVHTYWIKK